MLTSCSWAQLPANILILYIGAPSLLAIIICAWGTVGAATGTFWHLMAICEQRLGVFQAICTGCVMQ